MVFKFLTLTRSKHKTPQTSSITKIQSYEIQIWGLAKTSNNRSILTHQNITLQLITGISWYISNVSIYKGLNISIMRTSNHILQTIPFQTSLPCNKLPL